MENVEKPKVLSGQISHTVNVYQEEYTEAIRAYLEIIHEEEFENLSYFETEAIVYSFIQSFISGVETERFYENANPDKIVFLNFITTDKKLQSVTIAYCVDKKNEKKYEFIN
jgi:hypothetical protein